MGTEVEVLGPTAALAQAIDRTQRLFSTWEATLSRFLPDSELAYLNRHAGRPIKVSPLLWSVVQVAIAAAQATDGLFDPTLLRPLEALGYDESFATLPQHQAPAAHSPTPTRQAWRSVVLDASNRRITVPSGVGLDFGGIAKGMAVDAAIAAVQDLASPILINAGGDLRVTGTPPDVASWPIAVPLRHGETRIGLSQGALATSGIARRRWWQGTAERHHLLNPRTGLPATSGMWSVSVAAGQCIQAEVAAKVAWILGKDDGRAFLERQRLAGLLVEESGRTTTVGPWPEHREEADP